MDQGLNSLPSSWPLIPIGTICKVGAGNGAPQGDEFFSGGVYPFVRMQDVGRCQTPYITTTVDHLNDLALEKHNFKLWPTGALLIPKSGASVALNKRALLREPSYVVSHLAVLVPGPFVDSEYLYYLTSTLDMMRLALDPSYPSLRTSDLARLRIPLPPLSEQRRIVEILQEAEEIRRLRAEAEAKTAELIPTIFANFFGDSEHQFDSLPLRDVVEDFRYGTSQSSGNKGTITLRIPNILGDRISFDDLVTVEENGAALERLRLQTGDMLFVRTNGNPDYVGRCGVFDVENARQRLGEDVIIFASYLIRARLKLGVIRPWFLHAFLRSPIGRARVLKQARTAAGQYNINTEGLGAIRIPVPPLELQDRFLLESTETQQLTEMVRLSDKQLVALRNSLSAHAFSGQLTAEWRTAHEDSLKSEASDCEQELEQNKRVRVFKSIALSNQKPVAVRKVDSWTDLTNEQSALLSVIMDQSMLEDHNPYFTAESLSKIAQGKLPRNPVVIEGHLEMLSALGFIIPVSLEEKTKDIGNHVFGNCYRLVVDNYSRETRDGDLRPNDHTRSSEIGRLEQKLEELHKQL